MTPPVRRSRLLPHTFLLLVVCSMSWHRGLAWVVAPQGRRALNKAQQRRYGSSGMATGGFSPGDGKEGIEAHEKAMEGFELQVLHDDADVVVVTKPAGSLCVPGRFIHDSLVVRVAAHVGIKDYARMVVHRLDQGTSGVLVFAKNDVALRDLHAQLRPEAKNLTAGGDGGMQKKYVALVEGDDLDPINGQINLPLSKDMENPPKQMADKLLGKPSLTEYTIRSRGADRSLVELRPITGRTHQLRVHLSCVGHPILGDPFYASLRVQNKAPGGRLCLHAESLAFRHPKTQERLSFSTPYPVEWDEGMVGV